ncbi:LptF/LptG family permease [Roseivirga sp.]|uniref:LptF/LptG family permease n=1 Tax=Roseivirga sp. TaxID=1964215 RepID=UPI003B522B8D
MKKIDKLVFGSFIGPFLLTLIVVDFILLLVTLLKYFDQIMGKGLSVGVFAELITYFSISSSPDAFPLAVLLSSIMTFGNLGEHSELTAVKSSGISLIRALLPIFIFVMLLTGFTYYSNTELVPKTNLKTYSLLWDMRTKKPALDIKEGVFYDGIPGYSIKVNQKIGDEQLKDIIIYDHTQDNEQGNKRVILADSGRMYSFMNQRYLALELYNGTRYEENMSQAREEQESGGRFIRDKFSTSIIRFDLSSFDMGNTDEKLFRRSRLVQTREELKTGIDSMSRDIYSRHEQIFKQVASNGFRLHLVRELPVPDEVLKPLAHYDSLRMARRQVVEDTVPDSLVNIVGPERSVEVQAKEGGPERVTQPERNNLGTEEGTIQANVDELNPKSVNEKAMADAGKPKEETKKKTYTEEQLDAAIEEINKYFYTKNTANADNLKIVSAITNAVNNSRTTRNILNSRLITYENVKRDQRKFIVTKNQQLARSMACLIMFLIGAPIGAIIKKGGLGVPVIVSVVFFLIYYILNTTGDKWGKEGVVDPAVAVWMSNAILLPFGLFFLRQARNDARLFEVDAYIIFWGKVKGFFQKKPQIEQA